MTTKHSFKSVSWTLSNERLGEESATSPPISGLYRSFFKRAVDIVGVLLAAPLVLPVVLLVGLLVRRDGGPAFYFQDRVGRSGKVFRLWKLRSMAINADQKLEAYLETDPAARAEWNEHQKLKRDPRITAVGRLIRKTSLDELPQLWNVLRGDMSLVGPRPMMPDQARLYPGHAYYGLRPGLTGFWQIAGFNETSLAGRAAFDDEYFLRLSLPIDVTVLFATVWVVLSNATHSVVAGHPDGTIAEKPSRARRLAKSKNPANDPRQLPTPPDDLNVSDRNTETGKESRSLIVNIVGENLNAESVFYVDCALNVVRDQTNVKNLLQLERGIRSATIMMHARGRRHNYR